MIWMSWKVFSQKELWGRDEKQCWTARKQSPLAGYCLKRKLKDKCEWIRWLAIWLAWPNPTELPGQPDSKQIRYFSQTQRCLGRVFRHNTMRRMKKEEVLVDTEDEKKMGCFLRNAGKAFQGNLRMTEGTLLPPQTFRWKYQKGQKASDYCNKSARQWGVRQGWFADNR